MRDGNDQGAPVPTIDTHIHLFDPTRPQGAPYRGPPGEPCHVEGAFPETYAGAVAGQGLVGAIKVEASPWIEDNQWALDVIARHDLMVGMVANLQPDAAGFAPTIDRFARDPLFRGIRYGNLWGYDLAGKAGHPALIAGLRHLAGADLSLDTANQNMALLRAAVRIGDAVPGLRIILDHLPRFAPAPAERADYAALLHALGQRPDTFVKLSEVIPPAGGGGDAADPSACRDRLDLLTGTFGEDRVLFGSDWPNILQDGPLDGVFGILRTYYADKSRAVQEKVFWRNSLRAYKWRPRSGAQRRLIDGIAGGALTV